MASVTRSSQRAAVSGLAPFQTSTDLTNATYVGQRIDLNDGRQVRIIQNGGAILAPGKTCMGPVPIANWQNLTTVSYTAPSTTGSTPAQAQAVVTLGGTAVLVNEWMGGYAVVYTGTGAGQILAIASNTAQATTTGNTTITFGDAPVTALDATSTISILLNPAGSLYGTNYTTHGAVVTSATLSAQGPILGVGFYSIPASTATVATYGVVATKGIWAVLSHSGSTSGLDIGASVGVAGAVDTYVVASNSRLGRAVFTLVDTDYGFADLNI